MGLWGPQGLKIWLKYAQKALKWSIHVLNTILYRSGGSKIEYKKIEFFDLEILTQKPPKNPLNAIFRHFLDIENRITLYTDDSKTLGATKNYIELLPLCTYFCDPIGQISVRSVYNAQNS